MTEIRKEKPALKSDMPLDKRGFSAEFLTQLGYLVSDMGSAVDTFNGNDELRSAIKNVTIVISTVDNNPDHDLCISLDSIVRNGRTEYSAIISGKGV